MKKGLVLVSSCASSPILSRSYSQLLQPASCLPGLSWFSDRTSNIALLTSWLKTSQLSTTGTCWRRFDTRTWVLFVWVSSCIKHTTFLVCLFPQPYKHIAWTGLDHTHSLSLPINVALTHLERRPGWWRTPKIASTGQPSCFGDGEAFSAKSCSDRLRILEQIAHDEKIVLTYTLLVYTKVCSWERLASTCVGITNACEMIGYLRLGGIRFGMIAVGRTSSI